MSQPKLEFRHFCLLTLFAVIAVAPMLLRGVPGGNDAVQHYEFAQHVVDAVRAGDLFPHFAGNANHGFGDVGLRVYPPLSYYALATAYFVFGEWYGASIFIFFLIFLIGGVGVFLWSREFFDVNSSLAAAAIYTFAPFHLNEIYNNFLYAEFASTAILPFCFLFVTRVIRDGDLKSIFLLGLSFSLLIGTHLPMTVIGSLSMVIYAVAMIRFASLATYAKLGCSVTIGLILSTFYWVRMITEMDLVKHSQPRFFANIWSFNENFLFSTRTFTNFMNDGLSLWFGDLILAATIAICIPALFALRNSDNWKAFVLPVAILFASAVAFTTPVSYLIWNNVPLLQKVQFPWRWLNVATLAGSILAGAGSVSNVRRSGFAKINSAALALAASVLPFVFLSAFVVRAPYFTSRAEFAGRTPLLSDGETFEGWWPAGANREVFSRKEKIEASGRGWSITEWLPTKRSFTIEEGEEGFVSVSTFYYPHWKASVDGMPVATSVSDEGLVSLRVPKERVRVALDFVEPQIVSASIWVSAIAWLLALSGLIFFRIRKIKIYGKYS